MLKQNSQDDRVAQNATLADTHATAQKESGLSRAGYCRCQLSKPTSQETTLVPVTFASRIKINLVPATGSVLKNILPNNIAVEVDDGFSPTTLAKLLATLERR